MFLKLVDRPYRFFELHVFLLDFVDCYADDVDHVPEDCSPDDLNQSYYNGLDEVAGCDVAVADCDHGGVGPIV